MAFRSIALAGCVKSTFRFRKFAVTTLFVLIGTLVLPSGVLAQTRELAPRNRPPLPGWVESKDEVKSVLPPPPAFGVDPQLGRFEGEFEVREIRFSGNTVVEKQALQRRVAGFIGRSLSSAGLELIRDEITREYVGRGFVTSGAKIRDADVSTGILHIELIEGLVSEIIVDTDGWFSDRALRSPLRRATRGVLNVVDLEKALRVLQADPQIKRLSARLEPTDSLGASILSVDFEETQRVHAFIQSANDISPSIGGWRTMAQVSAERIFGFGERLTFESSIGTGVWQVSPSLSIPVIPFRSEVELYGRISEAEIVEEPFDLLDIETEVVTVGVRYRHRLFARPSGEISASLAAEWRRSRSFLNGFAIDFTENTEDGVARLFVLRPALEGFWRSERSSLAARATLSVGTKLFDSTDRVGAQADSNFFAWLGQIQFVRALPILDSQFRARLDVQLASDSLLGLERFSLGGVESVRGYRENALVRDNGVVGSIELATPFPIRSHWLKGGLITFVDAGHGWDDYRRASGPSSLLSVGGGFWFDLWDQVHAEIIWASDLKELPAPVERDLQDRGFHLKFSWSPPRFL